MVETAARPRQEGHEALQLRYRHANFRFLGHRRGSHGLQTELYALLSLAKGRKERQYPLIETARFFPEDKEDDELMAIAFAHIRNIEILVIALFGKKRLTNIQDGGFSKGDARPLMSGFMRGLLQAIGGYCQLRWSLDADEKFLGSEKRVHFFVS